ncbi:conserved hypothetical protein [Tenacibaculum maritimum]|uniref:hypothetical protein n=1 Tax=Tenacibaculum maritimum TaxID=107401 RepID=UPI0012E57781|nr:hypothetical protein [Tenacibaculum maritimum]CAA0152862.1 conserved hypothetical protein [Tenacibaculum maritimum]CAA0250976.1 conserved hypothetical protein [Tenacibaculum maritimum]
MNNPIQKRFDELVLKWSIATRIPKVNIIRIHAQHDEQSFINDFFEYMLALDTEQDDLVFLLETPWSTLASFSSTLLDELYDTITLWNTAEKPDELSTEKIPWEPDKKAIQKGNHAALFANNINTLANLLVPDKNTVVSFIIKMPFASKQNANRWLKQLLEKGLESHIRIGIADTDSYPLFAKIAAWYPTEVYTMHPNLDIDGAVEEMAAMGNPNAPEVGYRKHLAKLMTAVKNRDEKMVDTSAKKCLEIASDNLQKDANWLGQIILVYTTLYNDQIGYKDYPKALFFANKAVEAGKLSIGRIEPATAYRLYGQTLLGRGAIASLLKKHEDACNDYLTAAKSYEKCNDAIMQCESTRLFAEKAMDAGWNKKAVLHQLMAAFYLIDQMTPESCTQSTYPWLIKILYYWNGREKVLSDEEMKEKLAPYFGENFMEKIHQYGKASSVKETAYQH